MFELKLPKRTYAAYIFDCDGTLANSMPLHLNAWNHGLASSGTSLRLDPEGFMSVAGMSLAQTIDYWNELHDLHIDADAVINAKNAYFLEHRHAIQPIPPVVNFAQKLFDQHIPIAVASGGHSEDVLATLEIIGVTHLFPVVVTANDVKRAKPAPDLFLLAAQKLGVDPKDCCVLEDSPLGITAANIAEMGSVLVPLLF